MNTALLYPFRHGTSPALDRISGICGHIALDRTSGICGHTLRDRAGVTLVTWPCADEPYRDGWACLRITTPATGWGGECVRVRIADLRRLVEAL